MNGKPSESVKGRHVWIRQKYANKERSHFPREKKRILALGKNCPDKNLAKVIKIKPNGMYCKGRNHNFHWFGWAEMQGHVIESEKLRNKLFLEKITDLSLPFFLKTFLFPSQFIAKLFVSKHFWIVFFSFRGWQDNKEPGQDVCIHYAGKKVARTGCMH